MHDARVSRALTAFVSRAAGRAAEIDVEYNDGVATVAGHVASRTHARAIVELVRWHDGVERVVSRLRVSAGVGVSR